MRVFLLFSILSLSLIVFSSFIEKEDLVGTWRWLYILNTQSGEKMSIEKLTMAKEVKTEIKTDNTYLEYKTNSENKTSTTSGEWKLESDGTLSMKPNDKWLPSKTIHLSSDTLTVQMMGPMHLVMII